MKKFDDLSRRDFSKLTLAAFGGAVAGAMLGDRALRADDKKAPAAAGSLLQDTHICCGLNTCKGKGKDAKNSCAGKGTCAIAEAHSCQGENACAGQGPTGENACKGQGKCSVPVRGEAWKKVRAKYEVAMKKSGKKFGPAPKDCTE
jgi:hypothetical protein